MDWKAAAHRDLIAAYETFLVNHPGVYDPAAPGFREQLERARDQGLAQAELATDRAGHARALGAFSAVLNDAHARLAPVEDEALYAGSEWPGFIAAWRGKEMIVHHAGASSPAPVGATIEQCDGTPMEQLVKRRLLAIGFLPDQPGQWWAYGGFTFASDGILKAGRPEVCTFRMQNGTRRDAKLAWVSAPKNVWSLLRLASDGDRLPVGMTEPKPGIVYLAMPTFQPDEKDTEAYRAMFAALKANREKVASARAIVFDLRHNSGGSSLWSREAASGVWGAAEVEAAMDAYFEGAHVRWRASEGNAARVADIETWAKGNGNEALAERMRSIHHGMKQALAEGKPFYLPPGTDTAVRPAGKAKKHKSKLNAQVYAVVSGRCFSACLDALDVFTRFENVTLIGAPSSADTTYMEIREETLPSGYGTIVIPTKVWVGRPRQSGEFYSPDIEVTSVDWTTARFLELVEADLIRRKGEGTKSKASQEAR